MYGETKLVMEVCFMTGFVFLSNDLQATGFSALLGGPQRFSATYYYQGQTALLLNISRLLVIQKILSCILVEVSLWIKKWDNDG